jgi:ferredoxin-NADP reductase
MRCCCSWRWLIPSFSRGQVNYDYLFIVATGVGITPGISIISQ